MILVRIIKKFSFLFFLFFFFYLFLSFLRYFLWISISIGFILFILHWCRLCNSMTNKSIFINNFFNLWLNNFRLFRFFLFIIIPLLLWFRFSRTLVTLLLMLSILISAFTSFSFINNLKFLLLLLFTRRGSRWFLKSDKKERKFLKILFYAIIFLLLHNYSCSWKIFV